MADSEEPSAVAAPPKPAPPAAPAPALSDVDLAEYRKVLVAAEQKAQDDFDKTVLSLSGGALGISFVFLKDVLGSPASPAYSWALLSAWCAWGLSSLLVLASYWTSNRAIRHALWRVDSRTAGGGPIGGTFAAVTATLNALGAVLFVTGVFLIVVFAGANLGKKGDSSARKEESLCPCPAPNSRSTSSSAKAPGAPSTRPASSYPATAAGSSDSGQDRQGNR